MSEHNRRVTENDSEFLMRTLTKHQWDVIGRKLRAEVDMSLTEDRKRVAESIEAEAEKWTGLAWDRLKIAAQIARAGGQP